MTAASVPFVLVVSTQLKRARHRPRLSRIFHRRALRPHRHLHQHQRALRNPPPPQEPPRCRPQEHTYNQPRQPHPPPHNNRTTTTMAPRMLSDLLLLPPR